MDSIEKRDAQATDRSLNDGVRTLVIGHRNPDTDSICSAICFSRLKAALGEHGYVPCRAGNVAPEAQFVLDYFGVDAPMVGFAQTGLEPHARAQRRDFALRDTRRRPRGRDYDRRYYKVVYEYI